MSRICLNCQQPLINGDFRQPQSTRYCKECRIIKNKEKMDKYIYNKRLCNIEKMLKEMLKTINDEKEIQLKVNEHDK